MISTVTLDKVKIGETKTGHKNGKQWTLYPISICVNGKWSNGAVFSSDDCDKFTEGATLTLDFWKDDQYGWKFKLPSNNDIIKQEIELIKQRLDKAGL